MSVKRVSGNINLNSLRRSFLDRQTDGWIAWFRNTALTIYNATWAIEVDVRTANDDVDSLLNWRCASFVRSWSYVYDRFDARLVGLWTLVIEERVKLQRCHLCFEVRTTAKTDIQPLQPSAPRSLFSQLLVFVCSSSVFLTGALQQCTLMTYEMVYCASTVPSSPSTRLRNSTNYWPNKRTRSYDIRCQTLRNADSTLKGR